MNPEAVLAREADRWSRYQAGVAPLIGRLQAEFEARTAADQPELLASFGNDYRLILQPGSSVPVLLREDDSVAVDLGEEAACHEEFLIGDLRLDQAGELVIYTVDVDGSDRYQLRVRTIGDSCFRLLRQGIGPSVGWLRTSQTVVFTELDDTMRPARVLSCDLSGEAVELLYEARPEEYLGLSLTSDGATVLINRDQHSRRSVLAIEPGTGRVLPCWESAAGEQVQLDAQAGLSWLLRSAPGRRDELLVREAGPAEPLPWRSRGTATGNAHWEELVAGDGFALLVERSDGGQRLWRVPADPAQEPVLVCFDGVEDEIATLDLVPSYGPAGAGVRLVRDTWQSPARGYRTSPDGQRAEPVGTAREPARLRVRHLHARSEDGTAIPLTLLSPVEGTGPWPTVLYGYGAYGVALDPLYSPFRLSLIERGVAFAVAHLRGGGDLGPAWHEAGRQGGKLRAVQDYLACGRALISQGFTERTGLVARTRSAGAAVLGAAINQCPELFAAALLEVPFLDCLATLSDPDAPLTSLEWDEWGNPLIDPAARAALAALSPVDNVRPARYPAMLVTAGVSDNRVRLSEPLRYTEAVRAHSTSSRPVLLKVDRGGHLGHSDVEQDRAGEAAALAFVLDMLGRAEL